MNTFLLSLAKRKNKYDIQSYRYIQKYKYNDIRRLKQLYADSDVEELRKYACNIYNVELLEYLGKYRGRDSIISSTLSSENIQSIRWCMRKYTVNYTLDIIDDYIPNNPQLAKMYNKYHIWGIKNIIGLKSHKDNEECLINVAEENTNIFKPLIKYLYNKLQCDIWYNIGTFELLKTFIKTDMIRTNTDVWITYKNAYNLNSYQLI